MTNFITGLLIFVGFAVALMACTVAATPEVRSKIGGGEWEDAARGMYRFENNEVLCYSDNRGLQCKWKEQK